MFMIPRNSFQFFVFISRIAPVFFGMAIILSGCAKEVSEVTVPPQGMKKYDEIQVFDLGDSEQGFTSHEVSSLYVSDVGEVTLCGFRNEFLYFAHISVEGIECYSEFTEGSDISFIRRIQEMEDGRHVILPSYTPPIIFGPGCNEDNVVTPPYLWDSVGISDPEPREMEFMTYLDSHLYGMGRTESDTMLWIGRMDENGNEEDIQFFNLGSPVNFLILPDNKLGVYGINKAGTTDVLVIFNENLEEVDRHAIKPHTPEVEAITRHRKGLAIYNPIVTGKTEIRVGIYDIDTREIEINKIKLPSEPLSLVGLIERPIPDGGFVLIGRKSDGTSMHLWAVRDGGRVLWSESPKVLEATIYRPIGLRMLPNGEVVLVGDLLLSREEEYPRFEPFIYRRHGGKT